MDRIDGIRAFVAVARTGSFTAASAQLGLSNKLVSKYVGELEAMLGTRLFARTTRALSITADGESYLPRAENVLMAYEGFEGGAQNAPVKSLRITAPNHFGEVFVLPALEEFHTLYPETSIDLTLTDDKLDLAKTAMDLAIRIRNLSDSSLIARKLGETRVITVASPDYLRSNPSLKHPRDLKNHKVIFDTNSSQEPKWRYLVDGELQAYLIKSDFSLNGARLTTQLARRGLGLVQTPDIFVQDDLKSGALIEVLHDYSLPPLPINMLSLPSPIQNPIIQALKDFLAKRFGETCVKTVNIPPLS